MNILLLTISTLLFLSVSISPNINKSGSSDTSATNHFLTRKISTVTNPAGWEILNRIKTIVKDTSQHRTEVRQVDGVRVRIETTQVQTEHYLVIEDFYLDSDSEMRIRYYDVVLHKVIRYHFQDKTFATQVDLVLADKATKTRYGAIVSYIFIDQDGDGVSEVRRESDELTKIPSWILSNSHNY